VKNKPQLIQPKTSFWFSCLKTKRMYKSSKSDVRKKNTFSNGEVGKENNSMYKFENMKKNDKFLKKQSC
jgi:hypothetical protein